MTELEFNSKIANIKPGTFARIKYRSAVSLNAKAKKEGHEIFKIVEKTVRFGVNYFEIESVKEREANRTTEKREMKQIYESVVPNILYRHIDNKNLYVQFATLPEGGNTNVTWSINGTDATIDDVKNCGHVINSYWNNSGNPPEIQRIKIENIISIKQGNNI